MCKCERSTREDGRCMGLHQLTEQEYKKWLTEQKLPITQENEE
jgi:hypothetical protein